MLRGHVLVLGGVLMQAIAVMAAKARTARIDLHIVQVPDDGKHLSYILIRNTVFTVAYLYMIGSC